VFIRYIMNITSFIKTGDEIHLLLNIFTLLYSWFLPSNFSFRYCIISWSTRFGFHWDYVIYQQLSHQVDTGWSDPISNSSLKTLFSSNNNRSFHLFFRFLGKIRYPVLTLFRMEQFDTLFTNVQGGVFTLIADS